MGRRRSENKAPHQLQVKKAEDAARVKEELDEAVKQRQAAIGDPIGWDDDSAPGKKAKK